MALSPNLKLYIPACCEQHCATSHYRIKIDDALNVIKKTKIGSLLLQKIAEQTRQIYITTHPLSEACGQSASVRTRASNPKDLSSGSFIFLPSAFEEQSV